MLQVSWTATILYRGINEVRQFLRELRPRILQFSTHLNLDRSVKELHDDVNGAIAMCWSCTSIKDPYLRKGLSEGSYHSFLRLQIGHHYPTSGNILNLRKS